MDVIVETGEGLSNSNTYVGTDEFRDFAKVRGFTSSIPDTNEDILALMFRVTDYVEGFSRRFSGEKTLSTQALSYPRKDCKVAGIEIGENDIPKQLKMAIMYGMIAFQNGNNPVADISSEPFTIREVVGPIRVDYSEASQNKKAVLPMVNRYLQELFNTTGKISFLKV